MSPAQVMFTQSSYFDAFVAFLDRMPDWYRYSLYAGVSGLLLLIVLFTIFFSLNGLSLTAREFR